MTSKVIVGMSGGVDSSVAALLLLEQGYAVEGLFMKNWEEDDGTEYCTAIEDLEEASQVASQLGIKLHQANFAAEYWDNVFEHFLAEYQAGRTPNPDILCNREIKFKAFLEYAQTLGAEAIATGHYARIKQVDGQSQMLKGCDPGKDQSYFLHAVGAHQFARSMFPLGELQKHQVRQLAARHQFPNANRKDSTGICFIGERRFKDFLENYLPAQPGDIVTDDGEFIGQHQGLMFHTLGQRQGLGIGGLRNRGDSPWYVVAKDLDQNQLVVGQGNDHPALFSTSLTVSEMHWIDNQGPGREPLRCQVKVRYRQPDQNCTLLLKESGYLITFDQPQRAVTPGQSACLYLGDRCLGGGIITNTQPEHLLSSSKHSRSSP